MKKSKYLLIIALLVCTLLFSACSAASSSSQLSDSSSSSSSDSSSDSSSSSQSGYRNSDIDYPSYSSDSSDYSSSSQAHYKNKPITKYGYEEYTCDKLSICIPEGYTEKRDSPNFYYYNDDSDFIYVHIDELGTSNLTSSFFNDYLSGLKSKASDFNLIKKETTSYAGESGYHLEYSCNIASTDCYLNSYLVQHGDQMYTVTFTSRGFVQSNEFDKIEDDVLEMLYFED